MELMKGQKNIVLIGMRGSGKTAVGKILADKLGQDLIEIDELIVTGEGMSIPQIVEKYGWDYFRGCEKRLAKKIGDGKYSNAIISTGGGIVIDPVNIENLRKNGLIILLRAAVHTLDTRIGEDPNRPPLTDAQSLKDELQKVWVEREQMYLDAADQIIDTDRISAEEVANKILDLWQ